MPSTVDGNHAGTVKPSPVGGGRDEVTNGAACAWLPDAEVPLAPLRPTTAATIRAAPRANGDTSASSFQIQWSCGCSGTRSKSSSPGRRRPGHTMTTSAANPTIPAPTMSMNSAVPGARADLASIGVARESGARAAVAITAVSPAKAKPTAVAPVTISVPAGPSPWLPFDRMSPGTHICRSHQPFSEGIARRASSPSPSIPRRRRPDSAAADRSRVNVVAAR